MSLLFRFMTCLGCLVSLSFIMREMSPAGPSRSESESAPPFVLPTAIWAVLLARPDVQCELGIDDVQSHEVHDWLLATRDHARTNFPTPQPAVMKSEQESDALLQVVREYIREQIERSEIGLSEVLSFDQLQRLRQLSLQREGWRVFDRPEMIDSLELTSQQRQQIDQLSRRGFSPYALLEVGTFRRSELASLLTTRQRLIWEELIGEAFPFDHAVPFGLEYEVMNALTGIGEQAGRISSSADTSAATEARN